ncbi:MAG: 2-C-methyl-D-erythritol 2,4-cyclodiphosphate synthase [Ruminococcaceae bacterium]|nr:2-C-methyl-D-erythritol 2,4-cyclodiphosphate synthase [Oscillospiraceae bacterium]
MTNLRIGHGYDVHRLKEGRKLILGGVDIPYPLGLDGHSDADVLVHAAMDALLGAAALGDIGKHFPPSDNSFKDIDSLLLARRVRDLITQSGYAIVNLDCTLLCQKPKLAPHIPQMQENIAAAFAISPNCVSVKATTEEGLGFTGRCEGIAAHAVCLIEKL